MAALMAARGTLGKSQKNKQLSVFFRGLLIFSTCAVGCHNQAAQGRHGLALNWNLWCKILLFKSPFFTKASNCFGLNVLRLLMSNMPHKMLMYGAL